jgi:hypothetical protein
MLKCFLKVMYCNYIILDQNYVLLDILLLVRCQVADDSISSLVTFVNNRDSLFILGELY